MFVRKLFLLLLLGAFVVTLSAPLFAQTVSNSKTKLKLRPAVRPQLQMKLRINTQVKAKYMFGAVGDTVRLKAFLYVAGKSKTPIVGKKLVFFVGGKKIGSGKTDKKGRARVNYTVPNYIGQKTTLVRFYGEGRYQPSSGKNKFASINSATKLTAKDASGKPGREATIRGQLIRITDKKAVAGRKVVAELGGKVVAQAATRKSGLFDIRYKIPSSAKKPIRLKIRFNGDKMYLGNVANAVVDVRGPKPKVYLSWNGGSGMVGQKVTITAKLGKRNIFSISDGLPGKKIRIWRERNKRFGPPRYKPKVMGSGITDKHGIVRISYVIDDDAYSYLVGAHFDQKMPYDYQLIKVSDPKLRVGKSPVTVRVTCGLKKAKIGSTLMFLVKLTRNTDGRPLANKLIYFQGQKKKTSSLGTIAFFHRIKNTGNIGPRAIKAFFKEDKRYHKGEGSFTIDVLPLTN